MLPQAWQQETPHVWQLSIVGESALQAGHS
jgi:hypothetical protein